MNNKSIIPTWHLLAVLLLSALGFELATFSTRAQGTAFTYQGRLTTNGAPLSGAYDMIGTVYDAASGGGEVAGPLTNAAVLVSNGLFTTSFDFGPGVFNGIDLWLGLAVRPSGGGAYSVLTPLQRITPTPYAVLAGGVSGPIAAAQLPSSVVTNGAGSLNLSGTFTGNGSNLANVNAASLGGLAASNYWRLGGNTVGSSQFLGTVNNTNLELRANNETALRLSYRSNATYGVAPAVIGGYKGNSASFNLFGNNDYVGATIGGGGNSAAANFVFADFGTVAGGAGNIVSGFGSFVGGGTNNRASGDLSAVLGGVGNKATNDYSTAMGRSSVAGGIGATAMGLGSIASGFGSVVGGGTNNLASGNFSAVLGGHGNKATNDYAFAIGRFTTASGQHSTAMGYGTAASGNVSTALGYSTTASGNYSTAIGFHARALHLGSFAWADTSLGADFDSVTNDTFNVRARNGVWFDDTAGSTTDLYFGGKARQMINLFNQQYGIGVQSSTTYFRSNARFSWFAGGVHNDAQNNAGGGTVLMTLTSGGLTVNGTFVSASDRNVKEDFQPVNSQAVLEKVVALPLSQWRYKTDEERSRHLGPMAQDFKAAFDLGADDKHIATVDADGVALAAIQGLNQKVEAGNHEAKDRIQRLEAENAGLRQELQTIKSLLERLTQKSPFNR